MLHIHITHSALCTKKCDGDIIKALAAFNKTNITNFTNLFITYLNNLFSHVSYFWSGDKETHVLL